MGLSHQEKHQSIYQFIERTDYYVSLLCFGRYLHFQKNLCPELVIQSDLLVSYFELIYVAVSHKQCYGNWWNLDNCKERLQKRYFIFVWTCRWGNMCPDQLHALFLPFRAFEKLYSYSWEARRLHSEVLLKFSYFTAILFVQCSFIVGFFCLIT